MIKRKETYKEINKHFGKLKVSQVRGFESFFDEWDSYKVADARHLAYILATVWHETEFTMQPIEEFGKGKNLPYGKKNWYNGKTYNDVPHIYYGRGHVQNTWRDNYYKLTKANSNEWDFVNKPSLLLEMKPSIWATFYGMSTGLYTGKKLSDYFNGVLESPINARKIINGKDKAKLIANYYYNFLKSIIC